MLKWEPYHAVRRNADTAEEVTAIADSKHSLTWSALAACVGAAADDLGTNPEAIGIFGDMNVDWVVAFLVASISGKTSSAEAPRLRTAYKMRSMLVLSWKVPFGLVAVGLL